jgi:predicted Zn-dependent protease
MNSAPLLAPSFLVEKVCVESTGNASRGLTSPYASPPFVSLTNIVVKPYKGDIDHLISEVKDGVLITWTWDMPNIAPGSFLL